MITGYALCILFTGSTADTWCSNHPKSFRVGVRELAVKGREAVGIQQTTRCDVIITGNKKTFERSPIAVVTPLVSAELSSCAGSRRIDRVNQEHPRRNN